MSQSTDMNAVAAEQAVTLYAEWPAAMLTDLSGSGIAKPVSGDAIAVVQRGTEADLLGRHALTSVLLRKVLGR